MLLRIRAVNTKMAGAIVGERVLSMKGGLDIT